MSPEEREKVQAGDLPESLKGHDMLKLVGKAGIIVSKAEENLLERLSEAVIWRGRYPSATSHARIRQFAQIGSDIRHIKTLLQKVRRHVRGKDS